jgi:hypothetical protein
VNTALKRNDRNLKWFRSRRQILARISSIGSSKIDMQQALRVDRGINERHNYGSLRLEIGLCATSGLLLK